MVLQITLFTSETLPDTSIKIKTWEAITASFTLSHMIQSERNIPSPNVLSSKNKNISLNLLNLEKWCQFKKKKKRKTYYISNETFFLFLVSEKPSCIVPISQKSPSPHVISSYLLSRQPFYFPYQYKVSAKSVWAQTKIGKQSFYLERTVTFQRVLNHIELIYWDLNTCTHENQPCCRETLKLLWRRCTAGWS